MPIWSCTERGVAPRQRGDALLESLISVALTGIVGLGCTYAASRITMAQTREAVQTAAVHQLRNLLQTTPAATLCSSAQAITVANTSYTVTVSCSTPTVTVGGTSIASASVPSSVSLSVGGLSSLIGGSGTIVVSN